MIFIPQKNFLRKGKMIAILKLMTLILGFKVDPSGNGFFALLYIMIYSALGTVLQGNRILKNLHIFSDRTFEP